MDIAYIIRQLDLNKGIIERLMQVRTKEETLWRPHSEHWCMLEIVCHLLDEEVHDFRTRVKTALFPDRFDFVPIDPVGWVTEYQYIAQDYDDKVVAWLEAREESLYWLQSLDQVDWQNHLVHSELGPMTAARLLANWLAHDHIHIRQMLRVKQAYLAEISQEDLSYAGNW